MRDAVDMEKVRGWVDRAARVVVLTGAGISTESGIPDFRGPQGLWTKNPKAEKLSNIHYYMADPEVRKESWKARLEHPAWNAKPNAGHFALAALEKRGKLHALITQNIDELHQMAGNSPDKVIERALRVSGEADLFLAIGTSLQVYPIAGAVPEARAAGARVVILNAEATPFDGIADAVFREPIGAMLPQLLDT
jgi:NAD-dependent SIR2 family protein deacetylase